MISANAQINIAKHTLVHTWFYAKIKHSFFFAIIYAGDFCNITLLIIGLDFIDN